MLSSALSTLALALLSATGAASAAATSVQPDADPATLPDALPPLDDRLLAIPGAPPVRAFLQGRLRAELDDSRDFARVDDSAAGAALTGRVGVEATASGARATVVLGDGGRVGQRVATPTLVPRPVAAALYQVELAFDVALLGLPAVISVGRAPLVVADGRWIGAEPWDARGRTLDGARVAIHGERWEALAAAIWLGPLGVDAFSDSEVASGFAVLSARSRPLDATILDFYALVHRDGSDRTLPLTIPTLGARAQARVDLLSLATLELGAGGDVQGPITDERASELFAGQSGHAQARARLSTELSSLTPLAPDPFVAVSVEATGGDTVGGRSWRAPAPTQHGALGQFDFFGADNTWSTVAAIGGTTPGGLVLEGGVRVVGVLDALGPFVDPEGSAIAGRRIGAGLALVEGAGELVVPLRGSSLLSVTYAIGVPGAVLSGDAPAQRLMVALSFTADSDDDSPLPPLQ